jgi:SHS2 domain-containing protein
VPYHYLEDVAIADIAFVAEGRDLEEIFMAAAEATLNVMIENPEAVEAREERSFRLENEHLDMLLFNMLQELIYYKDAEKLMLRLGRAAISREGGHYVLEGTARGERLDPARHQQRADVKAVTLHQFRLDEVPEGWKATVILDI